MIGVLLWVVFVAGAASNELPSADTDGEGNKERRWLLALAMRCSILLSFEHTAAVTEALRRLLIVQDLLGQRSRGNEVLRVQG